MCGPLTCALFGSRSGPARPSQLAGAIYHFTRMISYALIGGALASVGRSAAALLFSSAPGRLLPWAFALFFLAIAFGLDRFLPKLRFASGLLFRLKLNVLPVLPLSAVMGLATPFLPCGPLYAAFAVALFADSFSDGARLMTAFALGTMPLYWLLQSQYFRLQHRISPGALQWARQGLALVSALLLAWRAFESHGAGLAKTTCIFCR
jgi:sulfite exporter TauE/SafE